MSSSCPAEMGEEEAAGAAESLPAPPPPICNNGNLLPAQNNGCSITNLSSYGYSDHVGSPSSFEFHRLGAVSNGSSSSARPPSSALPNAHRFGPSKWDDAEKWVASRPKLYSAAAMAGPIYSSSKQSSSSIASMSCRSSAPDLHHQRPIRDYNSIISSSSNLFAFPSPLPTSSAGDDDDDDDDNAAAAADDDADDADDANDADDADDAAADDDDADAADDDDNHGVDDDGDDDQDDDDDDGGDEDEVSSFDFFPVPDLDPVDTSAQPKEVGVVSLHHHHHQASSNGSFPKPAKPLAWDRAAASSYGLPPSALLSVSMRDMGTEMTPMASQEPSQAATPIQATTPTMNSPVSSASSTPQRDHSIPSAIDGNGDSQSIRAMQLPRDDGLHSHHHDRHHHHHHHHRDNAAAVRASGRRSIGASDAATAPGTAPHGTSPHLNHHHPHHHPHHHLEAQYGAHHRYVTPARASTQDRGSAAAIVADPHPPPCNNPGHAGANLDEDDHGHGQHDDDDDDDDGDDGDDGGPGACSSKLLKNLDLEEVKRSVLETRAIAWEEAEQAKYMAKFKREEAKILAWENHQKAKAEAEMRRIEVKLERIRCMAQEKMMSKIASAKRKGEERRAAAEARREEQGARTSEHAQHIRRTGRMPSFLGCAFGPY